jgi:hypothetical protein
VSGDRDSRVRVWAVAFLEEKSRPYGESLPWKVLSEGFEFEGRRVPLIGPQGIFKPAVLDDMPLSLTTAPPVAGKPRPYDDQIGPDGLLRYRYRGTDPGHPDNRGVRLAMQRRVPLVRRHTSCPTAIRSAVPKSRTVSRCAHFTTARSAATSSASGPTSGSTSGSTSWRRSTGRCWSTVFRGSTGRRSWCREGRARSRIGSSWRRGMSCSGRCRSDDDRDHRADRLRLVPLPRGARAARRGELLAPLGAATVPRAAVLAVPVQVEGSPQCHLRVRVLRPVLRVAGVARVGDVRDCQRLGETRREMEERIYDVVRRHLRTFLDTVADRTDDAGVAGFVAREFRARPSDSARAGVRIIGVLSFFRCRRAPSLGNGARPPGSG